MKILKWIGLLLISLILVVLVTGFVYMRQDKFGRNPKGERLTAIEKTSHFKDGEFANISITPQLAEGYSMFGLLYRAIFEPGERRVPVEKSRPTNPIFCRYHSTRMF